MKRYDRLIRTGLVLALAALGTAAITGPVMAGFNAIPVPEPGTLSLFATGAIAAAYLLHRKRK